MHSSLQKLMASLQLTIILLQRVVDFYDAIVVQDELLIGCDNQMMKMKAGDDAW